MTMARLLSLPALGLLVLCPALEGCLVPHSPKQDTPGEQPGSTTQSGNSTPSGPPAEAGEPGDDPASTAPKASDGPTSSIPSDAPRCETISPEYRCVPTPPEGWFGPVQPQKTTDEKSLLPCPSDKVPEVEDTAVKSGPNAGRNVYVTKIISKPAECGACAVQLNAGNCLAARFVVKYFNSEHPERCTGIDERPPPFESSWGCNGLSSEWLVNLKNRRLSVTPPLPSLAKAECQLGGKPTQELPDLEYENYYRVCDGVPKQGSCEQGQICQHFEDLGLEPRQGLSCIFSRGDKACPAGPFNDRRVVYGGVDDRRGCEGCEVLSTPGQLSCSYEMRLYNKDKTNQCPAGEGQLMRAEDLCLSYEQLGGDESPYSVEFTNVHLQYNGTCSHTPWEPTGDAELNDPLTLCCMAM